MFMMPMQEDLMKDTAQIHGDSYLVIGMKFLTICLCFVGFLAIAINLMHFFWPIKELIEWA